MTDTEGADPNLDHLDDIPSVGLTPLFHNDMLYGGADNPYEAIKVIEDWGLGFALGNALKYILRAGRKGDAVEDLRKARWYVDRALCDLHHTWFTGPRMHIHTDDVCLAHKLRGAVNAATRCLRMAASVSAPHTRSKHLRRMRDLLDDELSLFEANVTIAANAAPAHTTAKEPANVRARNAAAEVRAGCGRPTQIRWAGDGRDRDHPVRGSRMGL